MEEFRRHAPDGEGTAVDFEAFAYDQHPRLVASLTLYCGDRWVAEELAQEALVRVWERWDRVAAMVAPRSWLHRVSINLANSWWRRRQAERRAYRRIGVGDDPNEADSAEVHAVRAAVSRLPASQRGAVICRYFLEFSVAETAEALNLTPGSVKSATHRGLATLREQFDLSDPEEAHDVP